MSLTIAITGSNGMVGQGVVLKALSEGHKVIGLDIGPDSLISAADLVSSSSVGVEQGGGGDQFKYHQLDATDYSAYYKIIKDEGCNAIIHLAATFNKFGADGELLSHVPSHVRLCSLLLSSFHYSSTTILSIVYASIVYPLPRAEDDLTSTYITSSPVDRLVVNHLFANPPYLT
jgi:NAD(P)-dependent dehydrogenase (short-subunit alcohol dehydrogenase family)